MANVKISDLTAAASALGAQEFEVNESGTSKKVTGAQIAAYVEGVVSSDPTFTGQVSLADGSNTAPSLTNTGDTNTGIYFPASDEVAIATGGTERVRIDSSGNVGVGTSSPSAKLHVSAPDGTAPLTLNSAGGSDSSRALNFNIDGSNYGKILVPSGSGGAMAFWTGSANAASERMRIDSSGNLLVGTTSTSRAYANSSFRWVSGYVMLSRNTTSDTNQIAFFNPNGDVGSINTNGTSTSYNTSSDYRLKENVVPLAGAADRLAQIPVHRFNFISDPDTTVDGFLAHEVQAFVPECVTGEKDAVDADGKPVYQGIDQSKLVPLLTAALQESLTKIEQLEARIEVLEAKP